jgi:ATP-dependent DNA helicase DinG
VPGFVPRAEQIAMARAVGSALEHRELLVVEAGTGTGKTFAYLVPALLSGRHTIISTGTRTLQDQLFHRDLPALSAALGRPVTVALLKGRANYLCRHRLNLTCATPQLALGDGDSGARFVERVREWSDETATGDVSELRGVPEGHPVWPAVTSTRENCLGTQCAEFARCHVFAARRAALAADIVVVNHHLLLADFALKEEGFGDLLPGSEAVILDEAHQIPEIAAQFLGASFSGRQLLAFARDAHAALQGRAELRALVSSLEKRHADLRRILPPGANRIDWLLLADDVHDALTEIQHALEGLHDALEQEPPGSDQRHCATRAEALALLSANLRSLDVDSGVRWIETSTHSFTLQFTPFEVADRLQQWLGAAHCAWVLTSATLAIGDDFTHFLARIGAPDAHALRIESPFDFERQALLYLPQPMSEPAAPSHARDTVDAVLPLLEAAGGRAFILFTSHRALQEGSAWIRERLGPTPPYPVLTQGEAPREALLRQFRELGNAVLLGTGSFWEGVDVKGDALSIVAIDKLPFASPDDPLLKARLEGIRRRGGHPFGEYQLPQAALALKQGVGRLIRDERDFGVVVICDPRLATRTYGRVFLASLPAMPVTREVREAVQFLESRLLGERAANPRPSARG